ncbi:MAG: glycosyltransferase [Desulfovibrionaceae bacterium]|nr:glycosyltransferase [Desulfovibrionaceae bacterium]
MNIAFVNSTRKWGGVKTWTVDYSAELAARGHGVHVYGRQREFVDKLKGLGIPAERADFGFDYNPLAIGRFALAFRRHGIDLVVCNITKDMNTAGVAARLLRIPVIQRVGLAGDMLDHPRLAFLLKAVRPWMLCPSREVAEGVFRNLPYVPRERVKVIRNAKRPVDAIRPTGPKPLMLVSTSQVNEDKGHRFVLEALTDFEPGVFQYHVVGTGRALDGLREQYRALEERGDLVWHGFSTDVAAHLAGADVFLLPSMSEGMPNSLLEAMAAGLVPVARDVGGVKEIWPDSLAGYLMPRKAGAGEFREVLAALAAMGAAQVDELKALSLDACRIGFSLTDRVDDFEAWVGSEILS